MASRSGPRASGTDGSDYSHREQIASHYKSSADLKKSVQKCILPHMVIAVMYVFKQVAVFMGSTYFISLTWWEQLWLISGLCAFIGFYSLPKNDSNRLYVYVFGNLIFGMAPLVLGCMEMVSQMRNDFQDMKKTPKGWQNAPMRLAMIAVCLSWQVGGLVQAMRLIKAWSSMARKKDK